MGVENAAGFDAATCAGAAPGTLVATAAVCVGFDDETTTGTTTASPGGRAAGSAGDFFETPGFRQRFVYDVRI